MDKTQTNKLVKNGVNASVDSRSPQPRRVLAVSGKLRVEVGAKNNGTKTN